MDETLTREELETKLAELKKEHALALTRKAQDRQKSPVELEIDILAVTKRLEDIALCEECAHMSQDELQELIAELRNDLKNLTMVKPYWKHYLVEFWTNHRIEIVTQFIK